MTRTRILAALVAGLALAGAGTTAALADDSVRPAPTVAAVVTPAATPATGTRTTAPASPVVIPTAEDRADRNGDDARGSSRTVDGPYGYGRHGGDDDGPGHGRHGIDDGPGHDLGDDRGGDR